MILYLSCNSTQNHEVVIHTQHFFSPYFYINTQNSWVAEIIRDSENVYLCLQQEFNFVLKIVQEKMQIRITRHLMHMHLSALEELQ